MRLGGLLRQGCDASPWREVQEGTLHREHLMSARLARYMIVVPLVACSAATSPVTTRTCPQPTGEFPPSGCAILLGELRDAGGAPMAGRGLRVDNFTPGAGYDFTSAPTVTDARGKFELLVYRVGPLGEAEPPASAAVSILVFGGALPTTSTQSFRPIQVELKFARLGQPVEPVSATLVAETGS